LGIRVLVTDHACLCASIFGSSSFDFQERLEILEESHLLRIGHCVVLDVLLVRLEVIEDIVLLSEFCIEEVRVALELVGQLLIRLVDELGLVSDSLQKCFVDLRLNVVMVVFSFILAIIIKDSLDIFVQLFLLLIQIHNNIVVVFLFLLPNLFDLLHRLSELPQFLDFGS